MNAARVDKQRNQQRALAFVTIMHAYFAILNVVLSTIGLESITSIVTALIYIAILIYILLKCPINSNDLLILLVIYAVFVLNFFLFSSTRDEMVSRGMLILYSFFLPYTVLCFRKIRCWTEFWNRIKIHSLTVIYLGAFVMVFLPYNKYLGYMEFSYALLPPICALLYFAHSLNEKRMPYVFASIVGIAEVLAFGARAPAAYCLVFLAGLVFFSGFSGSDKKKIATIVILLLGAVFIAELNTVLALILKLPFFGNSYIIRRFISGKLTQSLGREMIWQSCFARLSNMGFFVGGFFGDREYCIGVYPHNIALEILMSWGWILGTMLLLAILILIVKSMRTKGVYRDVAWFYIMTCFSRYLLSGTYVREGKFWIGMYVLYAVVKSFKQESKSVETL